MNETQRRGSKTNSSHSSLVKCERRESSIHVAAQSQGCRDSRRDSLEGNRENAADLISRLHYVGRTALSRYSGTLSDPIAVPPTMRVQGSPKLTGTLMANAGEPTEKQASAFTGKPWVLAREMFGSQDQDADNHSRIIRVHKLFDLRAASPRISDEYTH